MTKDKIKWRYNQLPISWLDYTKQDFAISQKKYDELLQKLQQLPKNKSVTIFCKEAHKLFTPNLKDIYTVYGIDFTKYFDSVLVKEEFSIPLNKDLYVIYNVGLEKALNSDFASQLLKGLLTELQNNNKIIFIGSELNYTEFFKKYQIEVRNKISLKLNDEESII